jgi:hypothetical protein
MQNNNTLNAKIYWDKKGHTIKKCPADEILDGWYWPEENFESGTELLVWISPILVGLKWFEADIHVAHRSKTIKGKRHVKMDGDWITVPALIPCHDLHGRVGKDDENTLDIAYYQRPINEISGDVIKACIEGFTLGRKKFLEVFRNEDTCCT